MKAWLANDEKKHTSSTIPGDTIRQTIALSQCPSSSSSRDILGIVSWGELEESSVHTLIKEALTRDESLSIIELPLGISACAGLNELEWISVTGSTMPRPIVGSGIASRTRTPGAESALGSLPFNLVGVGMFWHTLVSSSLCPCSDNPLGEMKEEERGCFLQMIRHPIIGSEEGLDLVLHLYSPCHERGFRSKGRFFASPCASVRSESVETLFFASPFVPNIQHFSLRAAQSRDSFDIITIFAEKILVREMDNQLRIQTRDFLAQYIDLFDDNCAMCLLRRLIHSCPSPSLVGLFIDILRGRVIKAALASGNVIAQYPGLKRRIHPEEAAKIDENYGDDFLLIPPQDADISASSSPLWSNVMLCWFVDDTITNSAKWRSAQLLERYDELAATISLLTFVSTRLAVFGDKGK